MTGPNPTAPSSHGALGRLLAKSAKPAMQRPAESLTAHLAATLDAAQALLRRTGRIEALNKPFAGRFPQAVLLAALCHDAGKIPGGFQDMLAGLTRTYGERHEVLSLGFLPWLIEDEHLCTWVATGVLTHHRPLTDEGGRSIQFLYGRATSEGLAQRFTRVDSEAVQDMAAWLATTASAAGLPVTTVDVDSEPRDPAGLLSATHHMLRTVLDEWREERDAETGLAAVLLQGAVTAADRLSSAHQHLNVHQPLGADFPALLTEHLAERGSAPRSHQRAAGAHSGDLLLRAPTGCGKTEAGLLWAARQVLEIAETTGGAPRVYYTLPYLSSINAMARRLTHLLRDTEAVGVSHSKAASYHLAIAIAPEDGHQGQHQPTEAAGEPTTADRASAAARAVARAQATRLHRETVRIGTPYQLLRSALVGPTYAGTLLDTANSVFVLDELHAYDPRRLGYLLASARLWKDLGGRIAVLSATLPQALADVLSQTLGGDLTEISPEPEDLPPPRHRVSTREHHLTDAAACTEISDRLRTGESVLVVANNVAHALDLYQELAPVAREACEKTADDNAALLLHSRFRRGDRNTIEALLKDRYSTNNQRVGGLLVATQTVEVSLDVDFDVLFTAAAPLEALLQRFGRTNRVGARPPADVIVHAPAWKQRRGQGEQLYADAIYEEEPVAQGWQYLQEADGTLVSEADANVWLNEIYASSWGCQWRAQVEQERDAFQDAFLAFEHPFDDRSELADTFDKLFDGTEAILSTDRDDYEKALATAKGAAGRLLADDLLLPVPYWASRLARYDQKLRVRVIEGAYHEREGLLSVTGPQGTSTYQPGEIL